LLSFAKLSNGNFFISDETYDDIPEDDDFDYNHYSKPSTSTAPPLRAPKPVKKKKAKKPTIKFEKLSKDKPVVSDFNITFDSQEDEITQMSSYVERFPITDPRKPFVCQHCGVAFTREKALESHTKLHANQEPTHDCELCGDSFFDLTSLEEHLELRHNFSSRARKTGGKSSKGEIPRTAKVLETMEYDDSNSEYEPDKNNDDFDEEDEDDEDISCDKCDMSFKSSEALKRHIKAHFIKSEILSDEDKRPPTAGGSSHNCNVCGENFAEALDLLAHAEIHARFQPFKCQLCGDTFFEENKIKIHLMENHNSELTESSCRLCGKQCRDQRSLIKHSWEHSREKNHPCSKCGKTFHNKARLKRHMASHKNKSVICEICHDEFTDGRQLMNHRHSHTKANQFPCHECGKTFGSRSSQQIHIR
jgi:Zinc finger, C2H2 type/C2H2-type zinc finger